MSATERHQVVPIWEAEPRGSEDGRSNRPGAGEPASTPIDQAIAVLFALVAEAVARATAALLDQDIPLAESVVADDARFDKRCDDLTGLIKERLVGAARHPAELETLVAILQMVPELERSADLAEHIAGRSRKGLGGEMAPLARGIVENLGHAVADMWQIACDAYQRRSRQAAFSLREADDRVDELAVALVEEGERSGDPGLAVDLALVARFYERLGDHAVNLARRVDSMAAPRRLVVRRRRQLRVPGGEAPDSSLWGRLRRVRPTPPSHGFFELFVTGATCGRNAAAELSLLAASLRSVDEHVERIRDLERQGDRVVADLLRLVEDSFITPYDREDIHALGEKLDDVLDQIFGAASVIRLTGLSEPMLELSQLAETLAAMTEELLELVTAIRQRVGARMRLERIEQLERQGDAIFRRGMARLYSGDYEVLDVLRWKDILQSVEDALNAVEEAGDVVESILIKDA